MVSDEREFDVVVVGGGAVGENVADRASRTGLSVAIVEHALVGGECSYWACMPSKALLRPGAVLAAAAAVPGVRAAMTGQLDAGAVLAWRDAITHRWDDASQAAWVEGAGLTLVRGHARFTGPKALVVHHDGTEIVVRARHAVVVATGSEPVVPDVPGLADVDPWTSRDATSTEHVPARLLVLGGGVVGVETATLFADLGTQVTLVVRGDRVLAGAEVFAGEAVVDSLRSLGVRVLTGATAESFGTVGASIEAAVRTPERTERIEVDRVLVATGRRPRTASLGVETIGLVPGAPVEVDDALEARGGGGWLFAVGDVTGRTGTTHQGKYDARIAGDVIAARFGTQTRAGGPSAADERGAGDWSRYRATADHRSVPQVVFTRPEVAWVGLTEAEARAAGLEVRAIDYDLAWLAGASVLSPDYAGRARLVVDERDVVVGATFVGSGVAELLHAATIAVVGEVPLSRLWHAVPPYPTLSEVWLRFLETDGR